MRIDSRAPALAPGAVRPRPERASGAGFSLEADKPSESSPTRSAAPLATLDAILALQCEDDGAERRRRGKARGRELLDGLDALKTALLAGRVPTEVLARLARGLGSGSSGDRELDEIVAAIELRAKVELAKLGRADLL